jgi:hypothetical protein
VPTQHNGRWVYKPIETAYLHADSSDYGWGAVLNDDSNYQARGFWSATDRLQHITWKELRAVRHAVESFLPQLKGRRVLLHEDITAVVAALTKLTSRSPVMMTELRRLWYLLDANDIHIRPRYIRSAANVWADTLSREMDTEDWQLNPRVFGHLEERVGSTYDRPFRLHTQRPTPAIQRPMERPAVRGRRLPTPSRRCQASREQLLQPSLDRPTSTRRQTSSTTCHSDRHRPRLAGQKWYHAFARLATATLHFPAARDLLFPGRLGTREGVGLPAWSIVAFRLSPPLGYTPAAAP